MNRWSLHYQFWIKETHIQGYNVSICVLSRWVGLEIYSVFWYYNYWSIFCWLKDQDAGPVLVSLQFKG